MPNIPDDILTEPDVSPDTLANLGPLRRLAGLWASDQGVDINPKEDGPERRAFRERIRMDPIDAQTNGPQVFYGQVVLAGGTAEPSDDRIWVQARRGDPRFGICSTTFLEGAFRTDYYRIDITFNSDDSWTCVTRTQLAVRGKTPPFDHRDTNTLRRIAQPEPNPLFAALSHK